MSVAEVAQRNHVNTNLLFKWERLHERGELPLPAGSAARLPVTVAKPEEPRRRAEAQIRVKATPEIGAFEVEIAGAEIFPHSTVSETNLAMALRALAGR